jgi:hypothetical protein
MAHAITLVAALVELAFLPSLHHAHRFSARPVESPRGSSPVALAKTKAKAPKAKAAKAPGGRGFGAPPAPKVAPARAQSSAGMHNPYDNEQFVVSDYPIPVEDGQSTLFLGTFMIEDPSVCDDLVAAFEADTASHRTGVVGRNNGQVIDKSCKDSTEIKFFPDDPRPEWQRYVAALKRCTSRYVEQYPYAGGVGAWGLSCPANFQYYPPGGGYKVYHTERVDKREPAASRHLVFMTYLNDVTDDGGTQFFHQNVTVQPRKGLTVVWPADWTFFHRGVPSPTQEKRIVTGWFNFA